MQEGIRQLAAVMFTDMVGFTALMQKDEKKAKSNRDRHRKVLEKHIFEHLGKILQYYGDGTLSIFGSAIEAVICAKEIQLELQKEPQVPLRIGIHLGDIVYEDDGAYGDGLNVASRIESLSVAGAVLFSDKVHDEIKNHPELTEKSLGKFELKNVKQPVEIFALTNETLTVPEPGELIGKGKTTEKSVAVLPFVNMSADPENEYFSDGISEELINALTRVEGLLVTSRTSSFAFKGKNHDIREIGSRLDVGTILEGSVRKSGNKIRITAQLINTSDGYHFWSEVYDRKLEDIFEVQDEISNKIASKLKNELVDGKIKEPLVKSRTKNLEAYNLLLKGKFYFNKWSPPDTYKALEFFKKASEKDSDYSLPYTWIAGCYSFLGAIGYLHPQDAYPRAKEFALKSLELDSNLPDAHLSIGLVKFFFEWDWEGAKKSLQKSIELNPSYAIAHQFYAMYLKLMDKTEGAVREAEQAYFLDPLSAPICHCLGDIYFHVGRFDLAEEQYRKTLELDPNFGNAFIGLGLIYWENDELKKALEIFNKVQKMPGCELWAISFKGFTYAMMGNEEKALECLNNLKEKERTQKEIFRDIDFAVIYTGLKDYDKVFYHLERAYDGRQGGLIFIKNRPWKEIQKDPRFKTLMDKIGLPFKTQF
ncbi:tetratricopeptide repeat protein [Bacteroidota bacterium]